ncbi:MAG: DUF481 domain-containing protein [Pricia sp.]
MQLMFGGIFRTIAFMFCISYGTAVQAQLVNIESKRMHTDSVRFVLNSDLLFNYTDNNGQYILQIGANTSVQFKSKDLKSIFFLVGNANLIRSKDEDFQNSWFAHGRYNRKLSELLRAEAFVQSQNNQKLTITQRNLVGIGLRWKVIATETTQAYLGNSYMYEIETLDVLEEKFYNHRNSSYLSLNRTFAGLNLALTGTLYFQPLYRNIANHRILSQFKAEVPLTQKISLTALYNYSVIRFDSELDDDSSSNVSFGFTLSI